MSGAYQQATSGLIKLVKVIQAVEGTPGSFPNTTTPTFYMCTPVVVNPFNSGVTTIEGQQVLADASDDPDRAIYAANFRNNQPQLGGLYLVFRLENGVYILDNQMAFRENQ